MKLPRWAAPAASLALAVLAACGGTEATPTPARAPATEATPATSVAATSVTVRVRPTVDPTVPSTPEPPRVEAPEGYDRSCAAGYPWGRQVFRPFVCIEQPRQGAVRDVGPGDEVEVRGFAAGSFENNVVVEFFRLNPSSGAAEIFARGALTYRAPDAGMPGTWELRLVVPEPEPGTVRVLAYFESPRDGTRLAEAVAEVVLW